MACQDEAAYKAPSFKDIFQNIDSGTQYNGFDAKQSPVGGKLLGFNATFGEYDNVAISEAPSDEAGMTFILGLGSLGNVRTITLRAFTRDELKQIVNKLP